ncbi:MAG: hypothetical protein ACT4PY_01820 [Armatimonadota bacterium]
MSKTQSRRSVAVATLVAAVAFGTTASANAPGAARDREVGWDVAIDCTTWRFNRGLTFDQAGRGDSFIANGRLFRYGSLPGGKFTPIPSRSVGKWVQRGVMAATVAEIDRGARPAFFATWYHLPDDGSGIVADGPHPESGPMAVTGGMGRFRGVSGELRDKIIGENNTGCPNLRIRILLKRPETR